MTLAGGSGGGAIVPRWEWRTFGRRFGAAEAAYAAMTPVSTQDSDETYLLVAAGDSAKIRDDLMDIKTLRETDADGLQRWEPVFKVGFPLDAAGVRTVCEALHLDPPVAARDQYSLDDLRTDILVPSGRVRPVEVHKHRVRYLVGGCMSEVTDVTADGRSTRTIAIESEDKAAVLAAVHAVGLDGYRNTSYPEGLTALVEDRPPRYAVIDVGTNSVKFHVAEVRPDGGWGVIVDRAEVTRLGEGLESTGTVAPEALERTIEAIGGMADEARRDRVLAIAAVGTAGLRAARDQAAVLAAIRSRTGVSVEVISGEEESRLAVVGAQLGLGIAAGSTVTFDTGGGSTQFTFARDGRVDDRFSLEVGAVRYTERFGLAEAVERSVLDAARAAITSDLGRIAGVPAPDAVVAMGGAVTNLAAVQHGLAVYDPDIVNGTVLDRAGLDREIEEFRTRDAAGRRSIVGLQPKRADVILAGALIVRSVMEALGQQSVTVSDRGLRHGLLAERFGEP